MAGKSWREAAPLLPLTLTPEMNTFSGAIRGACVSVCLHTAHRTEHILAPGLTLEATGRKIESRLMYCFPAFGFGGEFLQAASDPSDLQRDSK